MAERIEKLTWITNDELDKFRLTFSKYANHNIARLRAKEFLKWVFVDFVATTSGMGRENQTIFTKDFALICSPSKVWSCKKYCSCSCSSKSCFKLMHRITKEIDGPCVHSIHIFSCKYKYLFRYTRRAMKAVKFTVWRSTTHVLVKHWCSS